jgi:hypothetical protein
MRRPLLGFLVLALGCVEPTAALDGGAVDGGPGVDAPGADGAASDAPGSDAPASDVPGAAAVLDLGLTVHLENDAPYDAAWASELDRVAGIFEAHGARLTLEPRQEILMGSPEARAVLATLAARGHAVGSHAALGEMAGLTQAQFELQLTGRRTALEAVVAPVEHVSGICSSLDFVRAAVAAGFTFTTGATAGCLTAMAPADRPAGYADLTCASLATAACHHYYPTDLATRLHPWRARDAAHWLTDDPAGELVVLSGSGTLPCLEEEAANPDRLSRCTLTDGDGALALAELDEALGLLDPAQVNATYWVWGSFTTTGLDDAVLERFLDAVDERVATGAVRWRTAHEVHEEYLAWEASHR